MDAHPGVPVLLLGREDNHGLVAARNIAIGRCRAAKVMVMDADNLVYPNCLRRLADALDADLDASFAYCMLEAFGTDPGLRSQLPWNPSWLCGANYIDAQAMIRRDTLERHGGYRGDDDFVYGWEDWDLWLRLAVAGEYGTFVPEMLGRYRTQHTSMVTITNLASDFLRERIEARYPSLPWPTR
jgi:glycosyltransferase involved in cell wall biosynthesis